MGAEQAADAASREGIDNHHLRCFRMLFCGVVGNLVRIVVNLLQGACERLRVVADFRTTSISFELSRARNCHLNQHGCNRRKNHH